MCKNFFFIFFVKKHMEGDFILIPNSYWRSILSNLNIFEIDKIIGSQYRCEISKKYLVKSSKSKVWIY